MNPTIVYVAMTTQHNSSDHLNVKLENDLLVKVMLSVVESDGLAFDTLDSKAGLVLGFGLVSIAELLGFLLLTAPEAHPLKMVLPLMVQILFYFGMGLLTAGTAFAMIALYPRGFVRSIDILTPEILAQPITTSDVMRKVLTTTKKNSLVLQEKSRWARLAAVLVPAGLFCFALVVLLLFQSVIG